MIKTAAEVGRDGLDLMNDNLPLSSARTTLRALPQSGQLFVGKKQEWKATRACKEILGTIGHDISQPLILIPLPEEPDVSTSGARALGLLNSSAHGDSQFITRHPRSVFAAERKP